MGKNDPLPEKYVKALQLIEAGNLSFKDIAKACHINESDFYDLVEGNPKRLGTNITEKFQAAYEEVAKRIDRDIKKYAKNCRKKTLYLLDSYLSKHKDVKKTDRSTVSALVSIANGLAKVTPNVEIGSFSYTKGLSAEDLLNEFKRIEALANARLKAGTIRGVAARGTREIPLVEGSGEYPDEKPEASSL